jgi:hypothetical protein
LALVAAGFAAVLATVADLAGAVAGFAEVWAVAAAVLAASSKIKTVFLMALSNSKVILLK